MSWVVIETTTNGEPTSVYLQEDRTKEQMFRLAEDLAKENGISDAEIAETLYENHRVFYSEDRHDKSGVWILEDRKLIGYSDSPVSALDV